MYEIKIPGRLRYLGGEPDFKCCALESLIFYPAKKITLFRKQSVTANHRYRHNTHTHTHYATLLLQIVYSQI